MVYATDRPIEINGKKVDVSENVLLDEPSIKKLIRELGKGGEEAVRVIASLCPYCVDEERYTIVPCVLFKSGKKLLMRKKCEKHGVVEDTYFSDYGMFKRFSRFVDDGLKLEDFEIKKSIEEVKCPEDCGLCGKHKSHTALGNIALTNRCDLSCWYCFFYAKEGEPIYEPSQAQVRDMLKRMKNRKPVGCNAVQLTGGEPTLRKDIVDIIRLCKEEGYEHVQLNTTGIALAHNPTLAKEVGKAGANVIYISFDGVTPQTNPKNYWEIPRTLENIKKAGYSGVVLVPTLIKGVNDHEVGDIIRFGAANQGVVRGVNFQPVSLVGRMPKKLREKQRITIPEVIDKIERQTKGEIKREDWYPVPCVSAITDFINALTEKENYRLSTHFACGAGTYVFIDNGRMIPITRFVDVNGFFRYLKHLSAKLEKSRIKSIGKLLAGGKLLIRFKSFIKEDEVPEGLKVTEALTKAVTKGNYDGLRDFHKKSLFLGMMHFMDPYNYDVDRVERCCIHYGLPNGTVVPFCTHNVLPALYRDRVQRRFSMSHRDWERKTGIKLKDEKYVRKLSENEKREIRKTYERALKL